MDNIEEYLKTLTPEEIEQHKDLIDECVRREQEIQLYKEKTLADLKKLDKNKVLFYHNMQFLAKISNKIEGSLSDLSLIIADNSFTQYCNNKDRD